MNKFNKILEGLIKIIMLAIISISPPIFLVKHIGNILSFDAKFAIVGILSIILMGLYIISYQLDKISDKIEEKINQLKEYKDEKLQ